MAYNRRLCLLSGVTIIEILMSAIAIQIVVHCIQTFLAMMVLYWWFDNPLEGSIVTLSFLMLLTGISGMFFGELSLSLIHI